MGKLVHIAIAASCLLVCSIAPAKSIHDPNGRVFNCNGETAKDCLSDCNVANGCAYNGTGPTCCSIKKGVVYKPKRKRPVKHK